MPLDKQNYENFYLGNGAEFKIMSEIYLLGYEAAKMNPDIGIDLLVTNKARSIFKGSEEIIQYLQIKSSFLIDSEAKFSINKEEMEFLISEEKLATVLCFFMPIIAAEPKSYDRGDFEPWRESLEAELETMNYKENFRDLRKKGCLSQIDFKSFDMGYIWLNNQQMKKAIDEKYFDLKKNIKDKSEYYEIKLRIEHLEFDGEKYETLNLIDKNNSVGTPISEIRNLYYLFKDNYTKNRIEIGDFLQEHY